MLTSIQTQPKCFGSAQLLRSGRNTMSLCTFNRFRARKAVRQSKQGSLSASSDAIFSEQINTGVKLAGGHVTAWFEDEPGNLSEETKDETTVEVSLTQVRHVTFRPHAANHVLLPFPLTEHALHRGCRATASWTTSALQTSHTETKVSV